jgi:hypothetical protein
MRGMSRTSGLASLLCAMKLSKISQAIALTRISMDPEGC